MVCTESLAALLQANWSDMEAFDISACWCHVFASAIEMITLANWAKMQRLSLSQSKLEPGAISQLVKGNWLILCTLNLGEIGLGQVDLSCLSQGKWPKLRFLLLCGNVVSLVALQQLTRGNWPHLHYIDLTVHVDDNDLVKWLVSRNDKTEQAVLSKIYADSRHSDRCLSVGGFGEMPVPAVLQAAWPCLKSMIF